MRKRSPLAATAVLVLGIAVASSASVAGAPPSALADVPPPEPVGIDLTAGESLMPTRNASEVSPCMTAPESAYKALGCQFTVLKEYSIPSDLLPEKIMTKAVPNCNSTTTKVNNPTLTGYMSVNIGATNAQTRTESDSLTETTGVTVTNTWSGGVPLVGGVETSVAVSQQISYAHSWSTADMVSLSKNYEFQSRTDVSVPPYTWAYLAFSPSYHFGEVLWTWRASGKEDLVASTIQTVQFASETGTNVPLGFDLPRFTPMTPAEVRNCWESLGGFSSPNPTTGSFTGTLPSFRSVVLSYPQGKKWLDSYPFLSVSSPRTAPVLRNVASFLGSESKLIDSTQKLTPQPVYLMTGYSRSGEALPLGERTERVDHSITMSAPSEVSFWLGGNCNAFTARVGYEVNGFDYTDSDTFAVFAAHSDSGKLVYDKNLTGNLSIPNPQTATGTYDLDRSHFQLDINVSGLRGAEVLVLRATRPDGRPMKEIPSLIGGLTRKAIVVADPLISCSGKVAANTDLVTAYRDPVTVEQANLAADVESSDYLNVKPTAISSGYTCVNEGHELGASCSGNKLSIYGKTYSNGIGLHSGGYVRWNVTPPTCSAFTMMAGFDDFMPADGSRPTQRVFVYIDGQLAPNQPVFKGDNTTGAHRWSWQLDQGSHKIEVKVEPSSGDAGNNGSSHVDIIEPALTCSYQEAIGGGGDGSSKPDPVTPRSGPRESTDSEYFVSDLAWSDASDDSFEVARDNNVYGNHEVVIDGTSLDKAVTMHSNGQLTVHLGAQCTEFSALAGLDDTAADNGSVEFQVWGDGRLLATSETRRGSDAAVRFATDLRGVQDLTLKVTDAGDNKDWDHAAWGEASVWCARPPAEVALPEPDNISMQSMLSDWVWTDERSGFGAVNRDKGMGTVWSHADAAPLRIAGVEYAKGLGMHSVGNATFALGGACVSLTTDVGIDDSAGSSGSVEFQVWGDGHLLAQSGVMRGTDSAQTLTVDLAGVQSLSLVVTDGGDGGDWDHGTWGSPVVSCRS